MNITIVLTDEDIRILRSLPISVSRVLKGAAELLDGPLKEIEDDQYVISGYLRNLEPILNRLFQQAKEQMRGDI